MSQLASIYVRNGEFYSALDTHKEIYAICRRIYSPAQFPNGHPELARSLQLIAHMYLSLNDIDNSFTALLESVKMWETLNPEPSSFLEFRDMATALSQLGDVYRMRGNYSSARDLCDRSYELLRTCYPIEKHPNGHSDLIMVMLRRSRICRDTKEWSAATLLVEAALDSARNVCPPDVFPDGHETLAAALAERSLVMFEMGEYQEALGFSLEATRIRQKIADHTLLGRSEAEALNVVRSQLRLSVVPFSALMHKNSPKSASAVYESVWNRRASVLRVLGSRYSSIQQNAAPELQSLFRARQAASRDLGGLLRVTLDRPSISQQLKQRLISLTARKEQLEVELARRLPRVGLEVQRFRVTPADLATRLKPHQAFIEFVEHPAEILRTGRTSAMSYAAFVLLPGQSAIFVSLGRADEVDTAALAFRQAISQAQPTTATGSVLRGLVWDPVERILSKVTTEVYLCADGMLTTVPFAALPGRRTGTFLLHDYAVALAPSGHFLVDWLQHDQASPGDGQTLLAVGGVSYNAKPSPGVHSAPATLRSAVRGNDAATFAPLPATNREVENIANWASPRSVTILTGAAANTTQVLTHLPQVQVAHFATHGYFVDEVPTGLRASTSGTDLRIKHNPSHPADFLARSPLLMSGLVLAGANATTHDTEAMGLQDDGILTAEAISLLPLEGLELVVLSACETALGGLVAGEGLLSLQQAFHLAGAKNVVATLWKVEDKPTEILMGLFYQKILREHKSPATALRESQLTLLDRPDLLEADGRERGRIDFSRLVPAGNPESQPNTSGRLTHPRSWAAFNISGAGF